MPYFGINQRFSLVPAFLKKCAPYPGLGVRHAPVLLCGLLRFNCAPCSGFCKRSGLCKHEQRLSGELWNQCGSYWD